MMYTDTDLMFAKFDAATGYSESNKAYMGETDDPYAEDDDSGGGGGVGLDTIKKLIAEAMGKVKSEIVEAFDGVVDRILGAVGDMVNAISESISRILAKVAETLSNFVNTILNKITETLQGVVAKIADFVNDIIESVMLQLRSVIDSIETLINRVIDYIVDLVDSAIDQIGEVVRSITDKVEQFIDSAIDKVSSLTESVVDYVTELVSRGIDYFTDLYDYVVEQVDRIVEESIEYVSEVYEQVRESVNNIMLTASEAIDESIDAVVDLAKSITDSVDSLITGYQQNVHPYLEVLSRAAVALLGLPDTPENRAEVEKASLTADSLYSKLIDPNDNMVEVLRGLSTSEGGDGFISTIVHTFVMFLVAGRSMADGLGVLNIPRSNAMAYRVMQDFQNTEFSTPEAVGLTARRVISESEGVEAANKGGYDDVKFSKLVEGARITIDTQRAIEAFNRGFIDDKQFTETLEKIGLRDDHIDITRKFIDVLPPLQDIITMAVREVFNKDVADKFELFSDLPEEFMVEARKQGLTEEWSKRYWGAHWRLPSANQGFEMFHRGQIDEDTLKMLLRALDVSPFWRDKLLNIAYQPITRVDIRRFYKLGLMTREDVIRRHLDIGYSPMDAEIMADFVEAYSATDEEDDDVDVRTLSMSQVKRLHSLGTITYESAVKRLIEAGYSEDTAGMLVDSWEDEEYINFRENLIARYTRKAIREDMDTSEIDALFSELNPTSEEITRIKQVIEVEQNEYDSLPSKTELLAMYKEGAIDSDLWFNTMRRHGYSENWIEAYKVIYKMEN